MSFVEFLVDPLPLLLAWVVGAALSVFVPLYRWHKARSAYYYLYGAANAYEQQQRAYEQANNNNNNQYNGNYYNNNYNSGCSWWQFRCRQSQQNYWQQQQQYNNNNNNNNGGEGEQNMYMPWWFRAMGGQTEEDRREREENGQFSQESSAVKFIYWWLLIIFALLVLYGIGMLVAHYRARTNPSTATTASAHHAMSIGVLLGVMVLFAQFALLTMIMMCQGVITTDDRELEDSIYGWYGQWGVLIVYTCFWYLIFSIAFFVVFTIRLIFNLIHHGHMHTIQQKARTIFVRSVGRGDVKQYQESELPVSEYQAADKNMRLV